MILRYKNKGVMLLCISTLWAATLGLVSCSGPKGGFESTAAPPPPKEMRFETVDQGLLVSWPVVFGASKYTLFWGPEKHEYRKIVETSSPAVIIKGLREGELNYFAATSLTPHVESAFSEEYPFIFDTDQRNASNHLERALQLETTGNFVEALVHITTAIKLDSDNSEFYRKRASIKERLGMNTEAEKDLATAAKLSAKPRYLSKNRPENLVSTVRDQF